MSKSFGSSARPVPSAPVSLAYQPTDPLYKVAEATGGEVVVGAGRLRQALDHFNDAYAVSYKSGAAGQSGVRSLEVRSSRPGLIVRAARATAGGEAAAEILAHGRAVAALQRRLRRSALRRGPGRAASGDEQGSHSRHALRHDGPRFRGRSARKSRPGPGARDAGRGDRRPDAVRDLRRARPG